MTFIWGSSALLRGPGDYVQFGFLRALWPLC